MWFVNAGRVEALAICPSCYLWCDPRRTKALMGGLCRVNLGDYTLNVSFGYSLLALKIKSNKDWNSCPFPPKRQVHSWPDYNDSWFSSSANDNAKEQSK